MASIQKLRLCVCAETLNRFPRRMADFLLIILFLTFPRPISLQAAEQPGRILGERISDGLSSIDIADVTGSEAFLKSITQMPNRCGLSIEPVYYGEVFSNSRGGLSTKDATRYHALMNLALAVDFEKAQLRVPGRFFLLAQNTHGEGLTENFVGDSQVISNIDAGSNIMRVGEYWWEFNLPQEQVTVRLGKQDVNTEFVFIDVAEDFIQSSFGLSPSASLPSYPNQSMAAVVLVQLKESLQLKLGVWDALTSGGSWGISGNDTVFLISELECKYALRDGTLPGIVSVAAAYLSDGVRKGVPFSAGYGFSVQIEQLVIREFACDAETPQGLAIFAAYYPRFGGPRALSDSIGTSYLAGLTYTGLIPQRDKDVLGVGLAWAELFQGGTNQEIVTELFYKAQVAPRVSVQPDLQYITSPSGVFRDSLAVGVRFELTWQ